MMFLKRVAMLACLAVPAGLAMPPAAAQSAPAPADLEVMANFFLPDQPIRSLLHGGCETAYRTKLADNPDDQRVEAALPGVHERMIAAASAYCDREGPKVIDRMHADIKADWAAMVSPADLARLARLVAPGTEIERDTPLEFRAGDMSVDAVSHTGNIAAAEARFERDQAAFARTPGGPALIAKLAAYQTQILSKQGAMQTQLVAVVRGGLQEAHREANAYAKAHGMPDVY
jgi:hypothetical protein